MKTSSLVLALTLASAVPALAQQTPSTAKTTEQQARSYVLSAFMTGSAPMILSEDVTVTPELRERLKLAPEAGSRMLYQELVRITSGKPLSVRPAIREEIANAQAHTEFGKPLFTVETGRDALVVQYDLERDVISFVGQPIAVPVATTAPVKEPAAPEATPVSPQAPALQVVEPQVPGAAVAPAAAPAPAPTAQAQARPAPTMKATGPCVIKPVMTDQDLVNCGATPR